ncbi:partner of Y14 and mago isoform X2 [Rhodamnia argentea]|uniref:Partner of Y14 and mago isoform X2 n=1 Tax=Rhodamnia argentea TaxID=178133 RepID=A0ABM3GV69_9MYRT|nr:partner of Y14 and mago isoform X2 [Rhodamnia argentea]
MFVSCITGGGSDYSTIDSWRKEIASQDGPPGYEPALDAKPKTKSAKRNEKRKEKRLQAALEKGKNLDADVAGSIDEQERQSNDVSGNEQESVKALTTQMNELTTSANAAGTVSSSDAQEEGTNLGCPSQDIDKRIRALKKKIRLAEAQNQKTPQEGLKSEQLEKLTKVEAWRQELKLLEDKKTELVTS